MGPHSLWTPDAHFSRWVRDRQLATNPLRRNVGDLNITRNGFRASRLRVLRKRVLCPLSAKRSHAGEDAGGVRRASSDHNELLLGLRTQSTQRFLSSVLKNKNKRNRRAKVLQTLFLRFALTVGAEHFGAVCDVPWAVLLDYRRKLIAHAPFYGPGRVRKTSGPKKQPKSGTRNAKQRVRNLDLRSPSTQPQPPHLKPAPSTPRN